MANLPQHVFRLEGYIDVPMDRIDAVTQALKEHIRLTREEPGCIFFSVGACPDIEGRFLVSEAFVDEAAFNYHQERAGKSEWAVASADVSRDYKTWIIEQETVKQVP